VVRDAGGGRAVIAEVASEPNLEDAVLADALSVVEVESTLRETERLGRAPAVEQTRYDDALNHLHLAVDLRKARRVLSYASCGPTTSNPNFFAPHPPVHLGI
jgi:hypothetical protein